jgi:YhgE/Pip-like protein
MLVRASQILRDRKIWVVPVVIAAVFVALMSVIYFGSVVNPTGHLHGLPVIVVNDDTGASAHGQRVDIGSGLVRALEESSGVTTRLKLTNATIGQADAAMDRAAAYGALVIPATSAALSSWPREPAVPAPASLRRRRLTSWRTRDSARWRSTSSPG